jgi:hypothetical protein
MASTNITSWVGIYIYNEVDTYNTFEVDLVLGGFNNQTTKVLVQYKKVFNI